MKIILDNGHGSNTAGKRSPDGRLKEWELSREIARRLYFYLSTMGYDATLLVPENHDVVLRERIRRANEIASQGPALLLSIHANASGCDGQWHAPAGWSAHVAPNASAASIAMAQTLADQALRHGLRVRQPLPGQSYWKQNLAICRDTSCPAVLTENLFMDNHADCAYLLSDKGKQVIIDLHLAAITKFVTNL